MFFTNKIFKKRNFVGIKEKIVCSQRYANMICYNQIH